MALRSIRRAAYSRLMSVRGFFRGLFHPRPDGRGARHSGDDLADKVRETIGPLSGGGFGGRITGSAVYRRLEDEAEHEAHRLSDEPDSD